MGTPIDVLNHDDYCIRKGVMTMRYQGSKEEVKYFFEPGHIHDASMNDKMYPMTKCEDKDDEKCLEEKVSRRVIFVATRSLWVQLDTEKECSGKKFSAAVHENSGNREQKCNSIVKDSIKAGETFELTFPDSAACNRDWKIKPLVTLDASIGRKCVKKMVLSMSSNITEKTKETSRKKAPEDIMLYYIPGDETAPSSPMSNTTLDAQNDVGNQTTDGGNHYSIKLCSELDPKLLDKYCSKSAPATAGTKTRPLNKEPQ